MEIEQNRYYICKSCGSINYVHGGRYERSSTHCQHCNQSQSAQVINYNLDEKTIVKENYRITSGVIQNYRKFDLVIEKYDSEISFKKAKRPLAKLLKENENLRSTEIAKTLAEHNTEKKSNINKYEFKFDSEAEREVDKIMLFKNGKKMKAVKSKLRDLLTNFNKVDLMGEDVARHSNSGYSYHNYYVYNCLMDMIKYPYKEILVKAGFGKMYLEDYRLNTDGTDPASILQVSKKRVKFLKAVLNYEDEPNQEGAIYRKFGGFDDYWNILRGDPDLDVNILKNFMIKIKENCSHLNYLRNDGINVIFNYSYNFENTRPNIQTIIALMKKAKEHNIDSNILITYLTEKVRTDQGLASPYLAFRAYLEMLNLVEELGVELDKYPKNLISTYDKLAYQRILRNDDKNKIKFAERLEANKPYNYENEKYIVISPSEIADLRTEGDNLNNCVGTYIDNYLKGTSKIYFMRKKEEPTKSYIALELNNNNYLVQSRGFNNRGLNYEEDEFVDEWMKHVRKTEAALIIEAEEKAKAAQNNQEANDLGEVV